MDRSYYLNLASTGLSMPIGADLILHEKSDAENILLDGRLLGEILEETAKRFSTPLAVPHMNLELEKKALLGMIGIPEEKVSKYHFSSAIDEVVINRVNEELAKPLIPEMQAQVDAIKYIVENTDLLPIGMSIGPFSLMTQLVADPITPVCMAGAGLCAEDDEEIQLVESVLELGMQIILHNIEKQIEAGAKAIFIAEPAANKVYFSPNQLESGSDIFERYVIAYNQRIKDLLNKNDVDLLFHCCGELTDYMVKQFTILDPAILTLGSSRKLWEDAEIVPENIVLYGNLPSKQFYSDELITLEDVINKGKDLIKRMCEADHPFILGSECDVLSVPGCHSTILAKAEVIAKIREADILSTVSVG